MGGVNLDFATISEAKILKIHEDAVPENTKKPRLQKVSLRSLSAYTKIIIIIYDSFQFQ